MINRGVELMIFCVTGDDVEASEIVDIPLENCVLKMHVFYNIDSITIDSEHPQYAVICTPGDTYLCNESVDEVREKIYLSRIGNFN